MTYGMIYPADGTPLSVSRPFSLGGKHEQKFTSIHKRQFDRESKHDSGFQTASEVCTADPAFATRPPPAVGKCRGQAWGCGLVGAELGQG